MASELEVRPALPSDLPQILQIINYWITTSPLITREIPMSQVDLSELYRKVKVQGLPFIVACPAHQSNIVYACYFTWPEMTRMLNLPGVMLGGVYSHPGVKGMNLFRVMQVHFLRALHQLPWFRGVIAETSTLNATGNQRMQEFPAVDKSAPFVLTGLAVKQGKWVDQRWFYVCKAASVQMRKDYEDLLSVKV